VVAEFFVSKRPITRVLALTPAAWSFAHDQDGGSADGWPQISAYLGHRTIKANRWSEQILIAPLRFPNQKRRYWISGELESCKIRGRSLVKVILPLVDSQKPRWKSERGRDRKWKTMLIGSPCSLQALAGRKLKSSSPEQRAIMYSKRYLKY
jgi:hypothetical protein